MGSQYDNKTSGSIKYGEFCHCFCGCCRRTALHLTGSDDCHYRSFRSGLAKVTHKTATQLVKELPEGRNYIHFCTLLWKGLGLKSLELLHLRKN